VGLGANIPEDAVYLQTQLDSAGSPYNGANKYVLHFAKGQTPPVNDFWSLTMYNQAGLFIANPINRYAIGNRNPLKLNADSSVDLYFQNLSPGKNKENNWLPAPAGVFNLTLRMYWPVEQFLSGNWTPPPGRKSELIFFLIQNPHQYPDGSFIFISSLKVYLQTGNNSRQA
jgi:hypothetical protein